VRQVLGPGGGQQKAQQDRHHADESPRHSALRIAGPPEEASGVRCAELVRWRAHDGLLEAAYRARRLAKRKGKGKNRIESATAVGVGIGCAYWLLVLGLTLVTIRKVRVLADLAPREPARWPKLSIIAPARDEAATLEGAMAGKLAQTGPEIEIVLVDDRSTDGTGAVVDRIAARPRAANRSTRPGYAAKAPNLPRARARHGGGMERGNRDVRAA
jgi:hypothetical protein